jgi:hypothetical protein
MIYLLLYLFFISVNFSMSAMGDKKRIDYDLQKKNTIESVVQQLLYEKLITLPNFYVNQDAFIASVTRGLAKIIYDDSEIFINEIKKVALEKSSSGKLLLQKKTNEAKSESEEKENHDSPNLQLPNSSEVKKPGFPTSPAIPIRRRKNDEDSAQHYTDNYEGRRLNFGIYNNSNGFEDQSYRGYCPLFELEDL